MAQAILLLMAAASLVDSTQASSLRITHYHNDWTVDSVSSAMHLCLSFGSLAWSTAEGRHGPVSTSQTCGTDKCALACVRFRALTGWHIGALRHANGVGERRCACIVQSHTLNLLADGIRETVAHVHSDWVCRTLIQLAHRWRRAGRASPTGTRSAHQAIHKRRSLSHAVQKNATIPLCVKPCVYV